MRGPRFRGIAVAALITAVAAAPALADVPGSQPTLTSGAPPAPSGAVATTPATPPAPAAGTGPITPAGPVLPDPATVRRALTIRPRPAWTTVLGASVLTAPQLAAWFRGQGKRERTTVSVERLARMFIDEGRAQNVRGDIAFVQSVLETGWFAYEGSMVGPRDNNFSGLGACDACRNGNRFPSPLAGVRAQIQHLAAYADPYADRNLARPLADARFAKVSPLGKAPYWEMMGSGNWATTRGYGRMVLGLWREALGFSGLTPPPPATPPAASAARG